MKNIFLLIPFLLLSLISHGQEKISVTGKSRFGQSKQDCSFSLPVNTFIDGKNYLDPNKGVTSGSCSGASALYGWSVSIPIGYNYFCGYDKINLDYDGNILEITDRVNWGIVSEFPYYPITKGWKGIRVIVKNQNFSGNFSITYRYVDKYIRRFQCKEGNEPAKSFRQSVCILKEEGQFGTGGVASPGQKLEYRQNEYTIYANSSNKANIDFIWKNVDGYCGEVFEGGQIRYILKSRDGVNINTASGWKSVNHTRFNEFSQNYGADWEIGKYVFSIEIKDRFDNAYYTSDFTVNVVPDCFAQDVITFEIPGAQVINGGYQNPDGGYLLEQNVAYDVNLYFNSQPVNSSNVGEIINFETHYEYTTDDGALPGTEYGPSQIEFYQDGSPGVYKLKIKEEIGSFRINVVKKNHLGSYCYDFKSINLFVGGSDITREHPCLVNLPSDMPKLFPEIASDFSKNQALRHFSYTIISHQGVIVEPEMVLTEGALLRIQVPEPVLPVEEIVDKAKNWVQSLAYDDVGRVIVESKQFYNQKGMPTQAQQKRMEEKIVLASEVVYDKYDRPAIYTLQAPVLGSTVTDAVDQCGEYIQTGQDMYFLYDEDFLTYNGEPYSFENFDDYVTIDNPGNPVLKLTSPDMPDTDSPGSLGWYYSNENTLASLPFLEAEHKVFSEPLTPASVYPYSRVLYYEDGSNQIIGQTLPGDYHHAGTDRLQKMEIRPVESADIGLLTHYLQVREHIYPGSVNLDIEANYYKQIVRDSEGRQQYIYLDKNEQPVVTVQTDGTTRSYRFYDVKGRLVCMVSPNGLEQLAGSVPFAQIDKYSYVYDHRGRLLEETGLDMGTNRYIYRKDNQLRFSQNAVQAAEDRFTYINYDRSGRVVESGEFTPCPSCTLRFGAALAGIVETAAADGGLPAMEGTKSDVIKMVYDAPVAGTSIEQLFVRGRVAYTERVGETKTWYSYDERGRLIKIAYNIPDLGEKILEYKYLPNGNVAEVAYQRGNQDAFYHIYTYDADARIKTVYTNTAAPEYSETGGIEDFSALSKRVEYFYYMHGPLKRIEYYRSEYMPEEEESQEFTQPAYSVDHMIQGIDYVYTIQGWLKAINHHDKTSDPGGDEDDLFGMLLHYHMNDYLKTGTDISTVTFTGGTDFYNGMIKGVTWFTDRPGSPRTNAYLYAYDANYQLSSAAYGTLAGNSYTEAPDQRYKETNLQYDKNGNLLSLKRYGATGSVLNDFTQYLYAGNSNRLSSISGYSTSYTYDPAGNLQSLTDLAGTQQFEYDSHGKMKGISSGSSTLVQFRYDASGQRYKKENPSYTTWYVRDLTGNILAIYDNNNGQSTVEAKEYPIYGLGRLGVYYKSGDYANYELSDHLGNVRVVLNEEGEREAYSDYYPYGLVMSPSEVAPDNYRYGYQGQFAEKDEETDWNAFELRMYDPAIGRWLGPDPYRQFYSAYVGMGNNPVSGVDPDGGLVGPPDRNGDFIGDTDKGTGLDYDICFTWDGSNWLSERGFYYDGQQFTMNPLTVTTHISFDTPALRSLLQSQYTGPATGAVEPVYIDFELFLTISTWGMYSAGKAALSGAAKGGSHLVYEGLDAAGRVRYVGITGRDAAVRFGEHLNSVGTGKELLRYQVIKGAEGLSKTQARIWEQTLINQYGLQKNGGILLNKVNSIAPKYWWQYGIK